MVPISIFLLSVIINQQKVKWKRERERERERMCFNQLINWGRQYTASSWPYSTQAWPNHISEGGKERNENRNIEERLRERDYYKERGQREKERASQGGEENSWLLSKERKEEFKDKK